MKIGVIGCGNMGGGMVANLIDRGQSLTCFDPDAAIMAKMAALGARTAPAARIAAECDRIILSLPKAAIVRAVMADIAPHLAPDTIILDTSTSTPETSQAIAATGICFVDGPVSGGPAAARAGSMTMLLGGTATAIAALRPLIDLLTAKTVIVGASGAGHAAKIANNMLCAANLVLVAEAVRLGQSAGVDPAALLEGINAGSGRSGVSEVNFPKWVLNGAFNSGFTMGLMRKDVGLALDLAAQNDISLEAFAPIARLWREASAAIPDAADFNEITRYTGPAT